ncbi:MAG: sigma-54 dependent transcriptional regulator [bacterium]|nr:sigma-54 dependent transcriptional regulator [bacterium]
MSSVENLLGVQPAILVVDDEANMRHMLASLLSKNGYAVDQAAEGASALALLAGKDFDYVLSDVRMPGLDGLDLLKQIIDSGSRATVIMMSAYGTAELAVEAMKQGAYDYISKPFKLDEVLLVLRKAQERERLRRENQRLKEELQALDTESAFVGMIGVSSAMQAVFQLAAKVAKFDSTVLITGESGTGKELIARGLHRLGRGEDAPFVAVNCGGVPVDLLESEFFGYAKGAFTGADREKKGLFESADKGTLFLDEIGEMPLDLQVKLLRVLQEGEVRRVGAVQPRKVDVRVLAATNRNLEALVDQGLFREDLFYRLNVFNVHIPPLREHPEDLLPLCSHFLTRLGEQMGKNGMRLAAGAQTRLLAHDWPGNVRELKSALERALILADGHMVLPEHLPEQLGAQNMERRLEDFFGTLSLKKAKIIMEKKLISRAMEHCGGNKSRAAEILEISYPALLSKLKVYDL